MTTELATSDSGSATASPMSLSDFDLDITFVAQGSIIADLMSSTSDNCGSTCQSACANSTC